MVSVFALYNFTDSTHKPIPHVEYRKVVADFDFQQIYQKGDALMSIPNLSNSPFFYHGYRKELDNI